jgi:hypothetical protein
MFAISLPLVGFTVSKVLPLVALTNSLFMNSYIVNSKQNLRTKINKIFCIVFIFYSKWAFTFVCSTFGLRFGCAAAAASCLAGCKRLKKALLFLNRRDIAESAKYKCSLIGLKSKIQNEFKHLHYFRYAF